MHFESWRDLYQSDLQSPYALWVAPAAFLLWLLASPGARARAASPEMTVARAWAVFFCAETLIDPLATGPLARWLALPDAIATGVMLLFVLLGDFRVFLLVFLFAPRGRSPAARAAAFTGVVPLFAFLAHGALERIVPDLPGQVLWLIYEVSFVAMALTLRAGLSGPFAPALRAATAYVAVYYALWAASDSLILAGVDAGWLLRIVPNQLYYSFWVPFAYTAISLTAPAGPSDPT